MLEEMGFMEEIVQIACRRCEIPDDVTTAQQKIDLVITWIFEHPDAIQDEEQRVLQERLRQEENEREQMELREQMSSQVNAAEQFLQAIGEVCCYYCYCCCYYCYYCYYCCCCYCFLNQGLFSDTGNSEGEVVATSPSITHAINLLSGPNKTDNG